MTFCLSSSSSIVCSCSKASPEGEKKGERSFSYYRQTNGWLLISNKEGLNISSINLEMFIVCLTCLYKFWYDSKAFKMKHPPSFLEPCQTGMHHASCMFLNSSLACVTTHVLARVITHMLARALLHVLAQSSGQFELACVATHVLARVATHVLGHVSIPITYLHCHQGHWCGQTRGRPWVSSSGISHMLVLLSQSLSSPCSWSCSWW